MESVKIPDRPVSYEDILNALQRRNRLRHLNDLAAEKDPGFALKLYAVRNAGNLEQREKMLAAEYAKAVSGNPSNGMGAWPAAVFPVFIVGGIGLIALLIGAIWLATIGQQIYREENILAQRQPFVFSATRIFPMMLVAGAIGLGFLFWLDRQEGKTARPALGGRGPARGPARGPEYGRFDEERAYRDFMRQYEYEEPRIERKRAKRGAR